LFKLMHGTNFASLHTQHKQAYRQTVNSQFPTN
jgi:hypothetical protein